MAKRKQRAREGKPWDEMGDTGDGGLVVLGADGEFIHRAPAPVTASLRYFVARTTNQGQGFPQRLAMTSAMRGEGVTFLSRSLGAVLAYDFPDQTAVVDLNWWQPSKIGAAEEQHPGIGDVLDHGVSIDEIIVPTSNPRLSLIPAGDVPLSRRPALARSDDLATLLEKLEAQFTLMILDLPAVRVTSDALSLCSLTDAFVLVVRQGVTPESQVEAAVDDLKSESSQPLGVILNRYTTQVPRRLRRLLGL